MPAPGAAPEHPALRMHAGLIRVQAELGVPGRVPLSEQIGAQSRQRPPRADRRGDDPARDRRLVPAAGVDLLEHLDALEVAGFRRRGADVARQAKRVAVLLERPAVRAGQVCAADPLQPAPTQMALDPVAVIAHLTHRGVVPRVSAFWGSEGEVLEAGVAGDRPELVWASERGK